MYTLNENEVHMIAGGGDNGYKQTGKDVLVGYVFDKALQPIIDYAKWHINNPSQPAAPRVPVANSGWSNRFGGGGVGQNGIGSREGPGGQSYNANSGLGHKGAGGIGA